MSRTIDIVPPVFRRFVGTRPPHDDPFRRARSMAFSLVQECFCTPSSPKSILAANGLLLCDETEDYLYEGAYGTMAGPYQPGSRPLLERYVSEFVRDDMSEYQKAMALLRAAHESEILPRFGSVPIPLYGESDEETLLKGGGRCYCRCRMLTTLCQVAGLEARPAQFWVIADPDDKVPGLGAHAVVEVRIDGHWSMVDPLPGLYVPRGDGRLASIRDIRKDPTLLTKLDGTIQDKLDLRTKGLYGMSFVEYCAHRYFQRHVPTLINRHEVTWPYHGKWNWATEGFQRRQNADCKFLEHFLTDLALRGELTEEVYTLSGVAFRDRFDLHEKLQLSIPQDALSQGCCRTEAAPPNY